MYRQMLLVLLVSAACAQDAKTVLENAAKAMGAGGLKSIQYSGSGAQFTLGQNVSPSVPWPRVTVKSYTRVIDYDAPASREEVVRLQGTNEQRVAQLVSGTHAWNVAGNNPVPAPAARVTPVRLTRG